MVFTPENAIIRNLGDGLVLRRSTPADAEKLFAFNALIHGEDGPDERIGQWARDLLEKPHPTFGTGDFTIVEEQAGGKIVSSLSLISQTWSYAGIPFGVGRPELVGTLPEYRNKGLVRKQFEEIHRWSAERGELVQGITGIPFYYRLYGYEMCVDLGGSRSGFEVNLPKFAPNSAEPYRFRPATKNDIPFIMAVETVAAKRCLLNCVRDTALWELELEGRSANSIQRLEWEMIERAADGQVVGYLAYPWFAGSISSPAQVVELEQGISWLDVTPSVVRHLWDLGNVICEREGKKRSAFTFALAANHPVYEVMRDNLPRVRKPYGWYLRVSDLPRFLLHIAPVLEERMENSLIPGFSGEARLNFFKSGLRLVFERGKLARIDPWQPDSRNEGDVCFPNLTFLQILFGHRTLDELAHAYADCFWSGDTIRVLINTLFPKIPSQIDAIG